MNKTITITKTVTEVEVLNAFVTFNGDKSVTYKETYSDGSNDLKTYVLTPEEYELWGNDDNYIKQLIVNKYQ